MSTINEAAVADPRITSRVNTELKAVVQIKERDEKPWKEVADITTVSRNGAGFTLSRGCSVGRLITLVLPMPRELRAYDEDKELYPVMGIVQYCNEGMDGGEKVFHIGVGLIGKNVPESFKSDPTQNYRITGMNADGLWDITETGRQFRNRKDPRFWISLPVTISLIQKEDKSITREETFTKNISSGGVSVVSSLNANSGDKVKFACPTLNFYAIGVVRNTASGDPPTLHVEFVGDEFPIDKIVRNQVSSPAA